ncbi:hypothetical protein AQF98_17505 [Pedobacter sp. Hv1]|nr:hypothetical protein AQF98_17505 [Pedobacter sp. Hv1]
MSNIPPFTGIFRFFLDQKHYRYSNSDGTSTFYEFMSRDFEMAKRRQAHCLLKKPDLKDRKHYRLFSKNPLAFWRWRLYFFDERYKLPYKNWEEIEKTRKSAAGVSGCITEF